jgi:phosphoglycolate phosphatase-like HAD superfamily hydrolase
MPFIFDLDQTLINSKKAESLRSRRQWSDVYKIIPFLPPFEGINGLIKKMMDQKVPFAIVTSSPSSYCNRVLDYWGWKPDVIVCFHDTQKRKPYPDPYLKAINQLNVDNQEIFAVGDDPKDIIAAKRAQVYSIGVTWGIDNDIELIDSKPDFVFYKVNDLIDFISERYFR